jgi:hypothetical protein
VSSVLIWKLWLLLGVLVVCAGATQYEMPSHIGEFVSFSSVAKSRLVDSLSHTVRVIKYPVHDKLHFRIPRATLHYLVGPRVYLSDKHLVRTQKETPVPIQHFVFGDDGEFRIRILQPSKRQLATSYHVSRAIPMVVHMEIETGHSRCAPLFFFYLHNDPRPFGVGEGFSVEQRSLGTLLGGLSGSQGDSGGLSARGLGVLSSRLHNVSLFFDRPQRLVNEPTGYSTNNHKKPVWDVCRGQQFTPWILGRFLGGLLLIVCAMLALDCDNWFGRIGGFLFVLGFVVLAAPVPWDLGPCPATQYQQTEYRQAFQHDAENVSQISVLWTPNSESIASMKSLKEWAEHGLMHLTVSFLFAVFGVELLVSTAAAWTVHLVQNLIFHGVEPPPHFYVVLGILIFCALSLFAIMISLLHKTATHKPSMPSFSPEISKQPPSRLKIISAHWGVEGVLGGDPDKVDCLLERQSGNIFTSLVGLDLFHGAIPAKGKLRLKVKYSFDGIEATVVRQDGEFLMLPEDPHLKSQTDMFSPLQIEAFQLAKDLREFFIGLGPRPVIDKNLVDGTAVGNVKGMEELHPREMPWINALTHGYQLRFKERVSRMRDQLGEKGVKSQLFPDVEHIEVNHVDTVPKLAMVIERLALELSYINTALPIKM